MSYETVVERKARKALARLPSTIYGRITNAIEGLTEDPHPGTASSSRVGMDNGSELEITGPSTGWTTKPGKFASWKSGIGREIIANRNEGFLPTTALLLLAIAGERLFRARGEATGRSGASPGGSSRFPTACRCLWRDRCLSQCGAGRWFLPRGDVPVLRVFRPFAIRFAAASLQVLDQLPALQRASSSLSSEVNPARNRCNSSGE